jgi:hypothetical protein
VLSDNDAGSEEEEVRRRQKALERRKSRKRGAAEPRLHQPVGPEGMPVGTPLVRYRNQRYLDGAPDTPFLPHTAEVERRKRRNTRARELAALEEEFAAMRRRLMDAYQDMDAGDNGDDNNDDAGDADSDSDSNAAQPSSAAAPSEKERKREAALMKSVNDTIKALGTSVPRWPKISDRTPTLEPFFNSMEVAFGAHALLVPRDEWWRFIPTTMGDLDEATRDVITREILHKRPGWQELVSEARKRFDVHNASTLLTMQWAQLKQEQGESVMDFNRRYINLLRTQGREALLETAGQCVDEYIAKLLPSVQAAYHKYKETETFQAALWGVGASRSPIFLRAIMMAMERHERHRSVMRALENGGARLKPVNNPPPRPSNKPNPRPSFKGNGGGSRPSSQGNKWCDLHQSASHSNEECRARTQTAAGAGASGVTPNKGTTTPNKVTTTPNKGNKGGKGDKGTWKCYNCQKEGHIAAECPEKKKGGGKPTAAMRQAQAKAAAKAKEETSA